jgi:transposase
MRKAPVVLLSLEERKELEKWARGRSTPHRLVQRARIVIRAADGMQNKDIATELGISEPCVGKWRNRFHQLRLEGIRKDAPRPGRNPKISEETVKAIIERTLHTKPHGATHWSTRTLGRALGISHMTVQRVWDAHNIKPHLTRSFKLPTDEEFVEKTVDVVGLYVNPPEHAVVLSFDEKTQIQALERAQTILPVRPGLPEGRSYDYRRNGTTDLFAAFNMLDGTVITEVHRRHRHQEFLIFLRHVDELVPADLQVHMIMDNLKVHTHDTVKRWLARHPRFRFHFVPKGASWMNAVERWFSEITTKQIRRGSFKSVPALVKAIKEFIESYNEDPRPFVWTKSPDEIVRKVNKIKQLLVTPH